MTLRDAIAVAAVLACVVMMLLLLRLYRRRTGADGESTRKLAHISTGILSLCLPWIFSTGTPIYFLCGASVALLLAMRYVPICRRSMSGALDVCRKSWGEICFPVSVALLYWLSHGGKLLYTVPLVVLTLADTVAALAGEEYGRHGYSTTGASKSLEGSIAFFCTAFFSVHVALLLFSDAGRIETLLIALNVALIVMLLEAIAWHGLDNVFIPLGVFVLLRIYMTMSLGQLWHRFQFAAALVIFVTAYGRRTTLQASALLASALVLYASWAFAGWRWLVSPLILLLAYALFFPRRIAAADRTHNIYAVFSIASGGVLWLLLARTGQDPAMLFPYTLAFAIHLAIIAWSLLYPRFASARFAAVGCVIKSWLLIFAPYVLTERSELALAQAGAALPLCAAAFAAFYFFEPRSNGIYPASGARWLRQAGIVLGTTLAVRFI